MHFSTPLTESSTEIPPIDWMWRSALSGRPRPNGVFTIPGPQRCLLSISKVVMILTERQER